jgi:hypothetical protein
MNWTHIDKSVFVRWYHFQKRWIDFGEISYWGYKIKLVGEKIILVCITLTLHQAQIEIRRFSLKIKIKFYTGTYKEFYLDIMCVLYTKFQDFHLKYLSILLIFNKNYFICACNVVSVATINLDLQWINIKTTGACKIAKNAFANYVIGVLPLFCTLSYRNSLLSSDKFCFRADMNVSMHLLSVFGKNYFRNESGNIDQRYLRNILICYMLFDSPISELNSEHNQQRYRFLLSPLPPLT